MNTMRPDVPARAPRRMTVPLWRRLGWRLGAGFLLLTAVGILVSGVLQYRAQDRWLRESLAGLRLNSPRTGSLLADGDVHEAVRRAGRSDDPSYARLRDTLHAIQEANGLRAPLYTLSHVDEGVARVVATSTEEPRIGEPYRVVEAIRPTLFRALGDGEPAYTGIYSTEHGTWITAFAPIRNAGGLAVGALEVDFPADVYLARLGALRRRLYLHSLAGAALALFAGVLVARRITRPVERLSRAAFRVVEGDFSEPARVGSRDEIGLLGNVFHLMVDRLQASHRNMVGVLVRALEARAGDPPGSQRRLAAAALALGDRIALTPAQREALELGALLHDVGEIRTPDWVLQKAGPLTADERRIVERHPAAGIEILEAVPLLAPALDIVASHHERWDGTGYPDGIAGEDIPLTARIFAVVDMLGTMTHERPYRGALPLTTALATMTAEGGKQLDPRVVAAALEIDEATWASLLGLPAAIGMTGAIR